MKHALMGLLLGAALPLGAGAASPVDLHAYWDTRCQQCHGDAGDFARRSLRVKNGLLVGTHHSQAESLQTFLKNHYLADELVAPVTAMLVAQANTRPLYRQHCARCHESAASFAREALGLRDGVLISQPSGRAVEATLRRHGGLASDEAAEVVQSLTRVLGEVTPR